MGGAAKWYQQEAEAILFQCRTRLCGWCSGKAYRFGYTQFGVSMPHAALLVVQHEFLKSRGGNGARFNAARGFVGGAAYTVCNYVSSNCQFQCRTRLCGWCSAPHFTEWSEHKVFQCRTRLCGWCSLVARSPFPPREKKPFWKVSGNLRVLTENM